MIPAPTETLLRCPCDGPHCRSLAVLRDGDDTWYESGIGAQSHVKLTPGMTDFRELLRPTDRDVSRVSEMGDYVSRMFPVTDNWSPNFPGNTVAVRCCPVQPVVGETSSLEGPWCIYVNGMDDTNMKKDFPDRATAQHCYLRLPVFLSQAILLILGFEYN